MEASFYQQNSKETFIRPLVFAFVFVWMSFYYFNVKSNKQDGINSDLGFKRLDELTGEGRTVAAAKQWLPIAANKIELSLPKEQNIPALKVIESNNVIKNDDVFMDGSVSLPLVELFNPQKYATNLKNGDYSGSIEIERSTIQSLVVNFPNGEKLELNYIDILGKRVFKYEIDREEYSGIILQTEDKVFVVSFVNGPHSGTRLKFSDEKIETQAVESKPVEENSSELNGVGFQF